MKKITVPQAHLVNFKIYKNEFENMLLSSGGKFENT